MTNIISVNELVKKYDSQVVLDGLNIQIQQGDIVGLLGKNGAGKSTFLKCLLNILPSDSGEIALFGEANDCLSAASKNKIGYVGQVSDEISWLSVNDLVKYRKRFYAQWSDELVERLIEKWQIDATKTLSELSVGQEQKVMIALEYG